MSQFVNEFHPEPSDIAVCGSMAHMDKFAKVIEELRAMGYTVATPDMTEKTDWSSMSDEEVTREKGMLMRKHVANVELANAVLICNYEKNGTENYIGTNTLIEMTAGFVLEKPIYLLNPVPEQNGREEILAMQPIVIHGDLSKIEEVK